MTTHSEAELLSHVLNQVKLCKLVVSIKAHIIWENECVRFAGILREYERLVPTDERFALGAENARKIFAKLECIKMYWRVRSTQ